MSSDRNRSILRGIVAGIVIGFTVAYVVQIFRGKVPDPKRLKGDDIALVALGTLVCALVLRPQILERLSSFELAGLKFALDKVREEQDKQAQELAGIRLVMPLLIPDRERAHLTNLGTRNTKDYKGSGILRDELMHLRSMGLIDRAGNRSIREAAREGSVFDLADYARLTDLGSAWLERLSAIDKIGATEPASGKTARIEDLK